MIFRIIYNNLFRKYEELRIWRLVTKISNNLNLINGQIIDWRSDGSTVRCIKD